MKKQLLLAAFLMGGFFTATAQEFSFETSEGYSLGSLDGQNDWGLTQIDEEGTTISGVEVNDVRSTTGTFSLSIAQDEALIQGEEGPFIGAFSPALDSDYNNVTISFDMYVDDIDDDAETGMDFSLMTQSNELALLTSNLYFVFDGRVAIQDIHEGETASLQLIEGVTYNFNAWNSVVIDYDFTAGTITYTLNDEVIFEGTVWNADALDHLVMFHDNWPGSTVYIDNLNVGETGVTATEDFMTSTLAVFPNPATNVINVTNNEVVNNVQIVDLNGRVVKSAKVNATEAQINISDLSAGVYMMNIATDKGTTTKKIVKN